MTTVLYRDDDGEHDVALQDAPDYALLERLDTIETLPYLEQYHVGEVELIASEIAWRDKIPSDTLEWALDLADQVRSAVLQNGGEW